MTLEPSPEDDGSVLSLIRRRMSQAPKKPSPKSPRSPILEPTTITPSATPPETVAKKTVTFSPASRVRMIPSVSFETDGVLAFSLWYTDREFIEMKERADMIVDLLRCHIVEPYNYLVDEASDEITSVIQNDDYCSLGLETCYGDHREITEALIVGGRAAVLLEHQTQIRDGYCSESLISQAYMEFSQRASKMARERGEMMAKAAGDWVLRGLPDAYVLFLVLSLKYDLLALESLVGKATVEVGQCQHQSMVIMEEMRKLGVSHPLQP